MSCYHPMLGVPEYRSEDGKWIYVPRGPYDPEMARTWTWTSQENKKGDRPSPIMLPCGHCIGCRLDQSRAWADRMMLELDHSKSAIFVTLTYNNENVPFTEDEYTGEFGALTLDKRDLQLFFKRLRKYFGNKEIRYYAAGEYGTTTYRPHYHAIIFGLSLEDFPDRSPRGRNELGQIHYSSGVLERLWSNGFVVLADVSWQTCAYVSRYVQKKVYGGHNFLGDTFGCEPEFSVMSRRPGIAGYYLQEHPAFFETSKIFTQGRPDGMSIPEYFLKKLKDENSSCYDPFLNDKIRTERRKFADDRLMLKLAQTDLSFVQQLELEENQKLLKASVLRRNKN